MKLVRESWRAVALLGVAITPWLSAQQEQWLQYHSGSESEAYRWLDLTTNPPPNVALPALQSQPLFARWSTPMDKAGFRWLCLDRSTKRGAYDRLFIDANGNGRLDDEEPVPARRTAYDAVFEPARLVFQTEDGPVTYHLIVRCVRYDRDVTRAYARPGCWYEGLVDFGGKKRRLRLLDNNVNGTFSDIAMDTDDTDRVVLYADTTDEKEGEQGPSRYLGRLIEVDGELYALHVSPDGAFVKVDKARDVAIGQVRVPETIAEFSAAGPMGHFVRKPSQGNLTLPVGKYRMLSWQVERKDDKGSTWRLEGAGVEEKGTFEVRREEPVSIDIGEPLVAELVVGEPKDSKSPITFGLELKGLLGEPVTLFLGSERPRPPRLKLASADGSYSKVASFQYG